MNCKNPYCPVGYDPKKKVCQDCKYKPDDFDMPDEFKDIFGGFTSKR